MLLFVHAFGCSRDRCSGCCHLSLDQILVILKKNEHKASSLLLCVAWFAGVYSIVCLNPFLIDFNAFFCTLWAKWKCLGIQQLCKLQLIHSHCCVWPGLLAFILFAVCCNGDPTVHFTWIFNRITGDPKTNTILFLLSHSLFTFFFFPSRTWTYSF